MLKRIAGRGSRAPWYLGSIAAATALLLGAAPADAAEVRQGDVVLVASGETIHDDLYAFGQTVTVRGAVEGAVFAAGSNVVLGGWSPGACSRPAGAWRSTATCSAACA